MAGRAKAPPTVHKIVHVHGADDPQPTAEPVHDKFRRVTANQLRDGLWQVA
jgi:hypothetical protein